MFQKKLKQMGAWALALTLAAGAVQFPAAPVKAADSVNIAPKATPTESSTEAAGLTAAKMIDGDKISKESRWSSADGAKGPEWVQFQWEQAQTIKNIALYWERRNAQNYRLEISDNGSEWKTVWSNASYPAKKNEVITLDQAVSAKYLRLYINTINKESVDPAETPWQTVSLYEIEVYADDIPDNRTDLEKIAGEIPAPGEIVLGDTQIPMPAGLPDGVSARFCADYEQVVGEDGKIYTPLSDKTVKGYYELSMADGASASTSEYTVVIPGEYTEAADANEKPAVIPELQEWHGATGDFIVNAASRVVVGNDGLKSTAEVFAEDYREITGMELKVMDGTESDARLGDFYMGLTEEEGLGKEGYTLNIDKAAFIEAEQPAGAYWATRTVLQILKQQDGTMPKGLVRDYPKYEVRGFSLDVGRKPFTLDTIYEFAKNMSWYKMNSFQVHLSDNLIFLEDYPTQQDAINEAYGGMRLQSDVVSQDGNTATAPDLYYTKDEFRSFIQNSRTIGVDIVPELDMPAHAWPFMKAFPEYRTKMNVSNGQRYRIDELDLSNPETTEWAKNIWNDYLEGDDPVFDEEMTVHIGTDEYHGTAGQDGIEQFRQFSDDMIKHVQGKGRKVRMWGSLSNKVGTTPVAVDGVELNVWNTGYANPRSMHELGYGIINTLDGSLYIVPSGTGSRGGYGDRLNIQNLYSSWAPNNLGGYVIPAGDDQMLGACYAVWHDNIDTRANGISQYDSFDRFFESLPMISAKTWGDAKDRNYADFTALIAKTGTAPGTNVYAKEEYLTKTLADYTFDDGDLKDSSINGLDLAKMVDVDLVNSDEGKAARLLGKESYLETPESLNQVGENAVLTMKVKLDSGADPQSEQILCESKDEFGEYGAYAIKAAVKQTGNVGFSREGYDYSFDYKLPENEWVELSFHSGQDNVALYVDGTLVDDAPDFYYANHPDTELSSKRGAAKVATMMVPFGRIGSKTDSFTGQIEYVKVTGTKEVSGDYNDITKTDLWSEVDHCDADTPELYTDVSWNAYKKAAEEARTILNYADSTEEDYIYAYERIQEAKQALQEKPDYYNANLNLAKAIEAAEEQLKDTGAYTPESVAAFRKAITSAKEVLKKNDTDKNALNAALSEMQKVKLVTKVSVAKTQLESAVAEIRQKLANTTGYSAEYIAALQQALKNAESILAKTNVTAAELANAMTEINNAELIKNTNVQQPPKEEQKLKKNQQATVNGVSYKVTDADKKEVTVTKGKNTKNVKIGATVAIDGVTCRITQISNNAFKNFKKVKSVVVGNYVTSIGKNAFTGCSSLATVTIGKNVKTINSKAFYNCKKLKKVVLQGKKAPSVKKNAFGKTASKVTVQAKSLNKKSRKSLLDKLIKTGGMSKKSTVK